jgi:hypothetical protein
MRNIMLYMYIPILSTTNAFAQEKIDCSMKSTGGWAGCKVETQPLSENHKYEKTSNVTYRFLCSPGKSDRFKIGIAFNDAEEFFNFGESGQVQLTGYGALRLIDLTSRSFATSVFKPGCSLIIDSIATKTSESQISSWKNSKASMISDLSNYELARDGFSELVGYQKAFSLLNAVLATLVQDVGLSKETRALLAPGTELDKLIKTLIFQTVSFKDAESNEIKSLTVVEKEMLMKLTTVISLMPADAECTTDTPADCGKVKLSKYFSAEDTKHLETVAAYAITVDKAQQAETTFSQLVKSKEQGLIELCALARSASADLEWSADEFSRFCAQ